jgi:hypothetical protein
MEQYLPLLQERLQVMENGKDLSLIHKQVRYWIMDGKLINHHKH